MTQAGAGSLVLLSFFGTFASNPSSHRAKSSEKPGPISPQTSLKPADCMYFVMHRAYPRQCASGISPIRDDEKRSRHGAAIGHGSSNETHDRRRLVLLRSQAWQIGLCAPSEKSRIGEGVARLCANDLGVAANLNCKMNN
jgi:hypothetical protein